MKISESLKVSDYSTYLTVITARYWFWWVCDLLICDKPDRSPRPLWKVDKEYMVCGLYVHQCPD